MSKFIKNSSIYLITTLILNASTFLLLPLYTRLISPDDYGNIYLMHTIATVVSMIASVQIQTSISRYYYDYKNEELNVKRMYTSVVFFTFVSSSVIYGLLFIFGSKVFFFLEVDFFPYMSIALLTSYLLNFYNIILALLYVEEKAKSVSIISIIIGIGSILLTTIFVIYSDDKLYAFLTSKLITAIFQFLVFVGYSTKYIVISFQLFNIREFVEYSVQRLPMGISSWIVTFADRFMVYGYIGAYENGVYSTGYKLGQIPDMLFLSINKAYVPYVFDKYGNLDEENMIKVTNIAKYLFSLYLSSIAGMIVFSKEFVSLLDTRYTDSLIIMIIILISYGLNGLKLIFHCPMDYKKEYGKIKSLIWISSSIINIVLNLVLIPIYGICGAAIATLISYLATLIPIIVYSQKAIKFKYDYETMTKVIILTILYGLAINFSISLVNILIKVLISIIYLFLLSKINNISLKQLKSIFSN